MGEKLCYKSLTTIGGPSGDRLRRRVVTMAQPHSEVAEYIIGPLMTARLQLGLVASRQSSMRCGALNPPFV